MSGFIVKTVERNIEFNINIRVSVWDRGAWEVWELVPECLLMMMVMLRVSGAPAPPLNGAPPPLPCGPPPPEWRPPLPRMHTLGEWRPSFPMPTLTTCLDGLVIPRCPLTGAGFWALKTLKPSPPHALQP